jgi:hypothetical protein
MLQRQIYPSTVPPVKNKSSQRRRKTFQKNMGVDDKIYPTEFIWLLHSSL